MTIKRLFRKLDIWEKIQPLKNYPLALTPLRQEEGTDRPSQPNLITRVSSPDTKVAIINHTKNRIKIIPPNNTLLILIKEEITEKRKETI